MNKKRLGTLLAVFMAGLLLCAAIIYCRYKTIEDDIQANKVEIVCNALDAVKSCYDVVRRYHDNGEYEFAAQEELVMHINLVVDGYEERYRMYEDLVGDIPRDATLPRVSITPAPTCTPTSTPIPTPTDTPTPTPTCTPTPTLTPTPSPLPTLPPIGRIDITAGDVSKDEYSESSVIIDGVEYETQIKWRGNSSTWLSKKSYNIKFSEKMSLYGMGEGKKWSLLATAYEKSLLRTPVGFWYADKIGLPFVSDRHIVEVWLNGVYKGVYVLIEPIQEGKGRIDIDLDKGDFIIECNTLRTEDDVHYVKTDKGVRFEINEPEDISSVDKQLLQLKLNEIETAIYSKDHEIYSRYIDVESFVNYYIFEEVTKNVDFGRASTRFVYKDGKLYAGPPWDLDLTMGNVSVKHSEDAYYRYSNKGSKGESYEGLWATAFSWYKALCEDEYFMSLVKERWEELLPITMNLVNAVDGVPSAIDLFLNEYQSSFEKNYLPVGEGGAGWKVGKQSLAIDYDYPADTYIGNVNILREWLTNRIDWLNNEFN